MSASAILKLQKVGFTTEQVEALADFMDTQAASKADLGEAKAELKADISELKAELKADVESAVHKIDLKIADLKAEVVEVKADLKLLEQRMTVKLGGMMIVAVGVLLAAIRYLPGH